MRHSTIIAVIAGVLTCAAVAQAGDVYKYVDERGNTLYTDQPDSGRRARSRAPCPKPTASAARSYAAQQSATNQQLAASNQRIAQGQNDSARRRAMSPRTSKQHALERCKQARADYNTSINSRVSTSYDKDGNRVYLTDAELVASSASTAPKRRIHLRPPRLTFLLTLHGRRPPSGRRFPLWRLRLTMVFLCGACA